MNFSYGSVSIASSSFAVLSSAGTFTSSLLSIENIHAYLQELVIEISPGKNSKFSQYRSNKVRSRSEYNMKTVEKEHMDILRILYQGILTASQTLSNLSSKSYIVQPVTSNYTEDKHLLENNDLFIPHEKLKLVRDYFSELYYLFRKKCKRSITTVHLKDQTSNSTDLTENFILALLCPLNCLYLQSLVKHQKVFNEVENEKIVTDINIQFGILLELLDNILPGRSSLPNFFVDSIVVVGISNVISTLSRSMSSDSKDTNDTNCGSLIERQEENLELNRSQDAIKLSDGECTCLSIQCDFVSNLIEQILLILSSYNNSPRSSSPMYKEEFIGQECQTMPIIFYCLLTLLTLEQPKKTPPLLVLLPSHNYLETENLATDEGKVFPYNLRVTERVFNILEESSSIILVSKERELNDSKKINKEADGKLNNSTCSIQNLNVSNAVYRLLASFLAPSEPSCDDLYTMVSSKTKVEGKSSSNRYGISTEDNLSENSEEDRVKKCIMSFREELPDKQLCIASSKTLLGWLYLNIVKYSRVDFVLDSMCKIILADSLQLFSAIPWKYLRHNQGQFMVLLHQMWNVNAHGSIDKRKGRGIDDQNDEHKDSADLKYIDLVNKKDIEDCIFLHTSVINFVQQTIYHLEEKRTEKMERDSKSEGFSQLVQEETEEEFGWKVWVYHQYSSPLILSHGPRRAEIREGLVMPLQLNFLLHCSSYLSTFNDLNINRIPSILYHTWASLHQDLSLFQFPLQKMKLRIPYISLPLESSSSFRPSDTTSKEGTEIYYCHSFYKCSYCSSPQEFLNFLYRYFILNQNPTSPSKTDDMSIDSQLSPGLFDFGNDGDGFDLYMLRLLLLYHLYIFLLVYKEAKYEKKVKRQAFQQLWKKTLKTAELKRKSRLDELGLAEEVDRSATISKTKTESLRSDVQKFEREEANQVRLEKEMLEREELFFEDISSFLYEQIYKNYFLLLDHDIYDGKEKNSLQIDSTKGKSTDAKLKLLLLGLISRIVIELNVLMPNSSNPSLDNLLEAMIPEASSKQRTFSASLSNDLTIACPSTDSILNLLPLIYNQKCTLFPAFQGLLSNQGTKWKSIRLFRQSNLNTREVERIMESLLPWRQSFCKSIFIDNNNFEGNVSGHIAEDKKQLSNVLGLELWTANVRGTKRQVSLFHDLLSFINECAYNYLRASRAASHLQSSSHPILHDSSTTAPLNQAEFTERVLFPQRKLVLGLKYFHYFLISWFPVVSPSSKFTVFEDLLQNLSSGNLGNLDFEVTSSESVNIDEKEKRFDFQIHEKLSNLSLDIHGYEGKELNIEDEQSQSLLTSAEEIKCLDKSLLALLSKLDFVDFVEDELSATENLSQNVKELETDRQSFHNELYNPKAHFVSKLVQILSSLLSLEQYQLSSTLENLESSFSNPAIFSKFKKGERYIATMSSAFLYGLRNILLDLSSSKSNVSFASSSLLSKLQYSQRVNEKVCE